MAMETAVSTRQVRVLFDAESGSAFFLAVASSVSPREGSLFALRRGQRTRSGWCVCGVSDWIPVPAFRHSPGR